MDRGYSERNGGFSRDLLGTLAGFAVGIGAGALAGYLLDPDRGARRRSRITDQITSARHRLPDAARVTARDISNRARGAWAQATRLFSSDEAPDQVIEARVRAKLGRVITHPHAIHVTSREGNVVLDGVV